MQMMNRRKNGMEIKQISFIKIFWWLLQQIFNDTYSNFIFQSPRAAIAAKCFIYSRNYEIGLWCALHEKAHLFSLRYLICKIPHTGDSITVNHGLNWFIEMGLRLYAYIANKRKYISHSVIVHCISMRTVNK